MADRIIILDYGMGNLFSVKKKFNRLRIAAEISALPEDILSADKLVIPGVGHFRKAIENLKQRKIWDPLNEVTLVKRIPVLGICLGMQLMARRSEEGDAEGLGWIDAEVIRFHITDKLKHKVPHMGWNNIRMNKPSALFHGVKEDAEFYFVHSFHMQCYNDDEVLTFSNYEYDFVSSVEKDNIIGMQFHPEKSHDEGEKLLFNFAKL
jgi:imidazole glycerol-phosphate synthase subunit HisH